MGYVGERIASCQVAALSATAASTQALVQTTSAKSSQCVAFGQPLRSLLRHAPIATCVSVAKKCAFAYGVLANALVRTISKAASGVSEWNKG